LNQQFTKERNGQNNRINRYDITKGTNQPVLNTVLPNQDHLGAKRRASTAKQTKTHIDPSKAAQTHQGFYKVQRVGTSGANKQKPLIYDPTNTNGF